MNKDAWNALDYTRDEQKTLIDEQMKLMEL